MYKHLLLSIVLSITVLSAYATPSWKINTKGGIEWKIEKGQLPHKDHIEMSGEQMAFVLRWEIDANGALDLERSLVFPYSAPYRTTPTPASCTASRPMSFLW